MPLDIQDIENDLQEGMRGNNKSAIGTSAGDLRGVEKLAQTIRSPCARLKWLEDNTPFHWEAFVTLTFNGGFQGLRITRKQDDSLVRVIKFPINGGDDANPYRQIPINHEKMIAKAIARVVEKIDDLGE